MSKKSCREIEKYAKTHGAVVEVVEERIAEGPQFYIVIEGHRLAIGPTVGDAKIRVVPMVLRHYRQRAEPLLGQPLNTVSGDCIRPYLWLVNTERLTIGLLFACHIWPAHTVDGPVRNFDKEMTIDDYENIRGGKITLKNSDDGNGDFAMFLPDLD